MGRNVISRNIHRNIVEVFFGNYQVLKKWWKLSWEKDLKLRVVFIGMSFSHIGWLISACATPRNSALPHPTPGRTLKSWCVASVARAGGAGSEEPGRKSSWQVLFRADSVLSCKVSTFSLL